MKIIKARYSGFILLEVLISLSILGIAMALLCEARVNQSLFDDKHMYQNRCYSAFAHSDRQDLYPVQCRGTGTNDRALRRRHAG